MRCSQHDPFVRLARRWRELRDGVCGHRGVRQLPAAACRHHVQLSQHIALPLEGVAPRERDGSGQRVALQGEGRQDTGARCRRVRRHVGAVLHALHAGGKKRFPFRAIRAEGGKGWRSLDCR